MSSLLLITTLWASPVSLLQETREIECKFTRPHPRYDRLVIERKDAKVDAYLKGKKTAEFTRRKFLDSAISLDGPNGSRAILHILMNGEPRFTEGQVTAFQEKDCDDTGASKTCKIPGTLFWSPEQLRLDKKGGAIQHYGFFANHATYFLAPGLALVDYGRDLDLFDGPSYDLNCHYLE